MIADIEITLTGTPAKRRSSPASCSASKRPDKTIQVVMPEDLKPRTILGIVCNGWTPEEVEEWFQGLQAYYGFPLKIFTMTTEEAAQI